MSFKADANESDAIVGKFTQLWFACFFERKLNKAKVLEVDLPQIVADLTQYFGRQGDPQQIDFRRAAPLLMGLHNLFVRRLQYLIRDSTQTLKEMTEPLIQEIKEELVDVQRRKPRN